MPRMRFSVWHRRATRSLLPEYLQRGYAYRGAARCVVPTIVRGWYSPPLVLRVLADRRLALLVCSLGRHGLYWGQHGLGGIPPVPPGHPQGMPLQWMTDHPGRRVRPIVGASLVGALGGGRRMAPKPCWPWY